MAGGLELSWLDVFTDRPLGGNPLAVVLDADELGDPAMQALARELGISETIFVREGNRSLRIFTPGTELPLAGHPVIGAAVELARRGRIPSEGTWTFMTGVGETPVELSAGTATMTQGTPRLGATVPGPEAAELLGLAREDVVGEGAICSTGVHFVLAEVRDREALGRVRPDRRAMAAFPDPDVLGLVPWCEEGPGRLAQRMFAPRMGIVEDPATGVAAGAVAALRVFRGAEPGRLTISQGVEIGRPSEIFVEVGGRAGEPAAPRIGGGAVLVFEGRLAAGIPPADG